MSAKTSIKKNYVYNLAYQLLAVLTPMITAPYLSRTLKAEGVGTASFITSVVANFTLFAHMGIWSYGRREISYLQDNREKRSWIFWNLKTLTAINVTISYTALAVLSYIYAGENYYLYLLAGIGIINLFFDINLLLSGMEDFKTTAVKNLIVRISYVTCMLMLIKSQADLPLYMCLRTLFTIAGNIAILFVLPKYVDKPKLKEIRPFHDMRIIWLLFLPNIAAEVYTVLDKTMIGLLTGQAAENGYYEFSSQIAKISLAIITSFSAVMIPRIGYLFAKNDTEQIKDLTYRSYSFTWFLGIPMCLGLMGVSSNLVPWFFGAGYAKVAGLMKITSFLVMAISLRAITGPQYLIPTQRHNTFTKTIVIGAVVNFCLNLIFIPLLKSYGAAIASVIAESSIAASQLYILRKEISIKKIISLGKNNYIAGLIMLAVLLGLDKILAPSIIHTFSMILSGAIVYFLMLIILRDKFFAEYTQKVLAAVRKRIHI